MRINPYQHIYNQQNYVNSNSLNSNTQNSNISNNQPNNNNILSGLLNNPNSIDIIKNFLPLITKSNTNTDNQAQSNSANIGNQAQSNNFPSINPQFALDTLLHPKKEEVKLDKTLDNSKQTLIKQMQLHQKMLNKINNT